MKSYSSPTRRSSTTSTMSTSSTYSTVDSGKDDAARSSGMPATVPELQAEVRELEAQGRALRNENAKLIRDLELASAELRAFRMAGLEDGGLKWEVETLREFIGDLRLGIRDLAEYEDVCG